MLDLVWADIFADVINSSCLHFQSHSILTGDELKWDDVTPRQRGNQTLIHLIPK